MACQELIVFFKDGIFLKADQAISGSDDDNNKFALSQKAHYTSSVILNFSMLLVAGFSAATSREYIRGDYILFSSSMFMSAWSWGNKGYAEKIKAACVVDSPAALDGDGTDGRSVVSV